MPTPLGEAATNPSRRRNKDAELQDGVKLNFRHGFGVSGGVEGIGVLVIVPSRSLALARLPFLSVLPRAAVYCVCLGPCVRVFGTSPSPHLLTPFSHPFYDNPIPLPTKLP